MGAARMQTAVWTKFAVCCVWGAWFVFCSMHGLPLSVPKGKGLKIPLMPTRVVVRGGVTCVPSMRLNLNQVHPHSSTVSLSMTREDPVMHLTATIAVYVCYN